MGEDLDINHKLFELPPQGEVQLPNFEEVRLEEVPQLALEEVDFDFRIQEAIRRKLIRLPVKLDFGRGGQMYLFAYDYESGVEGLAKFRGLFAADISADGQAMGSGYSLIDLDEVGRERVRPYVGHTFTEPGFIRMGLGLRRLIVLNEANKRWFKDSLGSGNFIPVGENGETSHSKEVWERLEAKRLVVKEGEGYRFK